ncbi:hypothetical protein [Pseudomonas sp. 8AS]|uniref:hypothetical protein n=1 Tax=Pseudomonas sp. 8AS TaxID=2653163 RepID=UPI00135975F0|nr:hypothetical protein [Pseudomonas sp. 8AS]
MASAKICRSTGVNIPDDVASGYMFFPDKRPGYQFYLFDALFKCLAFTLFPREFGDKYKQAMSEKLSLDCDDEEETDSIITELITYRNYALMGKVPKVK